ncbi:MAG: single-stranded DNA-binding protein [Treponema sp.]|nr:single-stranded DNA-binding protein [Treponema sp.]
MNNLNTILIEGNLARDPLLRFTSKRTPVCILRLASSRYYKQDAGFEKETSFFDVETWAKLAEHCYSAGHKGQGIRVIGRLKQDCWKGRDGKAYSRVTIVAEHIAFKSEFNREAGSSWQPDVPNAEEPAEQDDVSEPDYTETVVF